MSTIRILKSGKWSKDPAHGPIVYLKQGDIIDTSKHELCDTSLADILIKYNWAEYCGNEHDISQQVNISDIPQTEDIQEPQPVRRRGRPKKNVTE